MAGSRGGTRGAGGGRWVRLFLPGAQEPPAPSCRRRTPPAASGPPTARSLASDPGGEARGPGGASGADPRGAAGCGRAARDLRTHRPCPPSRAVPSSPAHSCAALSSLQSPLRPRFHSVLQGSPPHSGHLLCTMHHARRFTRDLSIKLHFTNGKLRLRAANWLGQSSKAENIREETTVQEGNRSRARGPLIGWVGQKEEWGKLRRRWGTTGGLALQESF